jgi:AraC-like DNA-binding protein
LPEQQGELKQLRREIARILVKGEVGIEHLARATGTSVRTLQRRLKGAGVNYSDLQDDVRKTLALNLLENETLALAEVAFSLGYSEVSAFNHAFRRWLGQSPGQYRGHRAGHLKSAAARTPPPDGWAAGMASKMMCVLSWVQGFEIWQLSGAKHGNRLFRYQSQA